MMNGNPNPQSPSQPDKDAARRLGQLPSAPTTPSSQPDRRDTIFSHSFVGDDNLRPLSSAQLKRCWEEIEALLTAARSDWTGEVLAKVKAINSEVQISESYGIEDLNTVVAGNINRIKAEVRAILERASGIKDSQDG